MEQSNTIKILHLTIKYKYFKLIAEGRKPLEYREMKPYWTKRIMKNLFETKDFDEIHIRNGYSLDKPFMRIKWNGMVLKEYKEKICFAIDVSEIIEIINYR